MATTEGQESAAEKLTDPCCPLCRKTCDSKIALTRHVTYCRRKARSHPRPRKKSCWNCTKAKTSCDSASPQCSRCRSRNAECVYQQPHTHSEVTVAENPRGYEETEDSESALEQARVTEERTTLDALSHQNQVVQGQLTNDFLTSVPASPRAEWDISSGGNALDKGEISWSSNNATALSTSLMSSGSTYSVNVPLQDSPFLTDLYTLGSPGALDVGPLKSQPRAFQPKPSGNMRLRLQRAYVISVLRSYPERLMSGQSLPPFIHRSCSISTVGFSKQARQEMHLAPSEPLAICASIAQMFKVKNRGNSSFVWSTVRRAEERLAREFRLYNDWDTVAALQAITIYFLLRISEEDGFPQDTDFDVSLIQTMVQISKKVNHISRKPSSSSSSISTSLVSSPSLSHSTSSLPWHTFILTESIRRTCITLLLIERFYDIQPGLPNFNCAAAALRSFPLPSSKALWETSEEAMWGKEWAAHGTSSSTWSIRGEEEEGGGGPLRYRDLVRYDSFVGDTSTNSLEEPVDSWLEGIDEFGALVVAAASLDL